MANPFRDGKIREQRASNAQINRENMKVRANQIDVHDIEATNNHIGENYMSNVAEDDGKYKYRRFTKLQKIQYSILAALIATVVIYSIIMATTS